MGVAEEICKQHSVAYISGRRAAPALTRLDFSFWFQLQQFDIFGLFLFLLGLLGVYVTGYDEWCWRAEGLVDYRIFMKRIMRKMSK